MFDSCGGYAFQFLDDITNPPVQLRSIGVEERDSVSYCWHNEKREEQYLFQYTLPDAAFILTDRGSIGSRLPPRCFSRCRAAHPITIRKAALPGVLLM